MSLGALPTGFTPPDRCLASMTSMYTATRFAAFGGPMNTEDGCFPPGYRGNRESYYSPATACPRGYSTACETKSGSEYQITCCPDPGDRKYTCISTGIVDWEKTLVCGSAYLGTVVFPTMTHVNFIDGGLEIRTSVETSKTASPVPGGVNAYGIQLRYRDIDVEEPKETNSPDEDEDEDEDEEDNDTTSERPSRTTITADGSVVTVVQDPSSQTDGAGDASGPGNTLGDTDQDADPGQEGSKGETGSGPGTGAIVGIAVGTALGVIALGLVALVFWWRKGNTGLPFLDAGKAPPAELPVAEKAGELSGSNYNTRELEGRTPPLEGAGGRS